MSKKELEEGDGGSLGLRIQTYTTEVETEPSCMTLDAQPNASPFSKVRGNRRVYMEEVE